MGGDRLNVFPNSEYRRLSHMNLRKLSRVRYKEVDFLLMECDEDTNHSTLMCCVMIVGAA